MNILIVSQYFSPENLPINYVAKLLVQNGNSVEILTGKPNYPKGEFYEGFNFFSRIKSIEDDIKIYRLPIIPRGKRFRSIGLSMNYLSFVVSGCILAPIILRKKKYDAILVYANSPITKTIPAILIGKIKKIPVILWVQDLWPESFIASGYKLPPFITNIIKSIVNVIYKNVDLILGQSKSFAKKIIEENDFEKKKVGYLPNTIDSIFLSKPSSKSLLPNDLIDIKDNFNILFTGNLGEAQSVETILRAAKKLDLHPSNRVNFILVGGGSKFEFICSEIKKEKIKNIFMLGQYPIEMMPVFIEFCDALLITLKKDETFKLTIPNKLQSYLASGKAVLGCIDGEGASVIKEAGAGLVSKAEDYISLSEKAFKLSNMPQEELVRFGRNGRKYFQDNFSSDKFLKNINYFLNEQIFIHKEKYNEKK